MFIRHITVFKNNSIVVPNNGNIMILLVIGIQLFQTGYKYPTSVVYYVYVQFNWLKGSLHMKIKFIDIQNFRKLKNCRINLTNKETLFVGANNSGKTSATDALINFLDHKVKKNIDNQNDKRNFSVTDFTLSNWETLNHYAKTWLSNEPNGDSISDWQVLCPSIDVWLDVELKEVHKVSNLIPSLKWRGGELGVRLVYQPKNIEELRSQFIADFNAAKVVSEMSATKNPEKTLLIWPRDMKDFLAKNLNSYFEISAYVLNPLLNHHQSPQILNEAQQPLEHYPFNGLFKVDVIEAQRGFSDPNSKSYNSKSNGGLSGQLNQYYSRHLNPTDQPDEDDLEALVAIDDAKTSFDKRLNTSFEDALGEIKGLGYPGFNDPDIQLSSRVNPVENLAHDAAVIFDTQKQGFTNKNTFSLPEKYNGLGYKNLIYMVFKLIGFRDQWMRKGKASLRRKEEDIAIEPLHLVLIEEPEAHLHAQVQQVFIRKAYAVLRNGVNDNYSTQMIVSSHSSYIALEAGFEKLRYFKRKAAQLDLVIPSSEIVDLSEIFGTPSNRTQDKEDTAKFVARYLKTTHCDLFFANGIIVVEGAAERMLLPHFISNHYKNDLNNSYISILEVGGAHAQRLRPLIDALGLPTLIITDTDAVKAVVNKSTKLKSYNAIQPKRNQSYLSGSDTLKDWFELKDKTLDEILDLADGYKIKGNVRAAYQFGIKVRYNKGGPTQEAIPYTFEDALAVS
ncbi:MAG: putative ATP-dependent endonuclease of OLD family [Oleiphilaceae bacterium]|jgi:predicted ATP-dependent endonuclease of OLD family